MMRFLFVYLLLVCLFIGCKTEKKKSLPNAEQINFPEPTKLTGKKVLQNQLGKTFLHVADTLVIGFTQQTPFFHIYNLNFDSLATLGSEGRGPGEFVTPPMYGDVWADNNEAKLLIENQTSGRMNIIDILRSTKNNKIEIDKNFQIAGLSQGFKGAQFLTNHEIVGTSIIQTQQEQVHKPIGFHYNLNSQKLKKFDLLNLKTIPSKPMAARELNTRFTAAASKENKVAFFAVYYPLIEIIDLDSSSIKEYLFDKPTIDYDNFELEAFEQDEYEEYVDDVHATDNLIYILYSGYKANTQTHPQFIKIMDWQGHAKAAYTIPAKYKLLMIDVDEKNRIIYGSSFQNDAIYTFRY